MLALLSVGVSVCYTQEHTQHLRVTLLGSDLLKGTATPQKVTSQDDTVFRLIKKGAMGKSEKALIHGEELLSTVGWVSA